MKNFLIILYVFGTINLAAQNEITTEQWKEDIHFLAKQMPFHHINLFKKIDSITFISKIDDLINQVDSSFDRNRAIVEIAKIVSSIKDGHSFVDGYYPLLNFNFNTFPFRLYEFKDGIYIQATHKSFQQYLGARIISINGIDINKCSQIVSSMFPIENKMGEKLLSKYGLTSPEVLESYNIIDLSKPTLYEIELNGKKSTISLSNSNNQKQPKESFGIITDKEWVNANSTSNNKLPLYLKNIDKMYWFEYISDLKLFYVQFNMVNDSDGQSLLDFFDEIILKTSKLPINKFVLDLRLNIGGETKFINPIVEKLSNSKIINNNKTFYVLIGRSTFSTAQLISYGLKQKSKAYFVGEPTSINSHFYANSRKNIELPNSHLKISLSTKEWKATKENKKYQIPDKYIEVTFENYKTNFDPVINWIISR